MLQAEKRVCAKAQRCERGQPLGSQLVEPLLNRGELCCNTGGAPSRQGASEGSQESSVAKQVAVCLRAGDGNPRE